MRQWPPDRSRPYARRAARGRRLKALIVIPARAGSTRLPGKPLHRIAGRTLLERVVDLARRAMTEIADAALVVATDDVGIHDHARSLGCDAVMTDPRESSGSARALAAARLAGDRPDIIVNLQGDAPFQPPAALAATLAALRSGDDDVATPVVALDWDALDALRAHKLRSSSSGTTCARGADGRALWFSKAIIPAIRDEAGLRASGPLSPVWRHIGLYAYRMAALEIFSATPPTALERIEGLEQLRLLEIGLTIAAVAIAPSAIDMSGIDTEADVLRAEKLIALHGDPFGAR